MPERESSQTDERGEHKDSQPQAPVSGDEGVLRSPQRMLSGSDNPLHSLLDSMEELSSETKSELRFNNLEQIGRLRPQQERHWGGQGTATERLPDAMLDHLVERPLDSLRQLLDSLEREASRARATLDYEDIGTVRQVGDGVASVWGLPQATTDELLQFPNDVLGLVMNLDRSYTDCILLGSDERIQGGDVVRATGERIMIPVGERLLGRVVDPLGCPLDDLGRVYVNEERFIEREAPGVIARHAVDTPLQTGIKAIDAVIPIGRGQRELIIGDRQTGKTTLALDTIINQADQDVVCVYVSMGQKRSSVLQALRSLEENGALDYTIFMVASPDDPPALIYLAPYAACTMAEAFLDRGRDVLIVYDDLSKHADAYRELSLLLRRPPGREAYPGDIFYLHARLLERACRLGAPQGGGSLTALPIVETQGGNISAYIPTNLISITDGQIYLTPELFNQGIRPAIDVGQSVSRVGGEAQTNIMRRVSSRLKLSLAQYEEVEQFARFGAEIDRSTRQQLVRGERLREALKQKPLSPLPLARQVLILRAVDQGYVDDVPVDALRDYEEKLWHYAQRNHPAMMRSIQDELAEEEMLLEEIDATIQEFAGVFEPNARH